MIATHPAEQVLIDRFGRRIDYLRVSLTDRCNFRCVYCMPEQGFPASPIGQNLTFNELIQVVRIAVSQGIRKVRLTGGEPLLKKDIVELVRQIADFGIEDLSCTTNGFLLKQLAKPLAEAGLHRVNISLDTLKPERFKAIARRGDLAAVLNGIDAALDAGMAPIKLNCVTLRGVNDDEAADFAALSIDRPLHVRFIELMPMRWNLDEAPNEFSKFEPHGGQGLLQITQSRGDMLDDAQMRRMFVPAAETKALIEARYGSMEDAEVKTNGPARTFRIPSAQGTVGFISQITTDLCSRCNRLRLTHDGFLRPCLMSDGELDLKPALRGSSPDEEVRELFRSVVAHKPERHYLAEGQKVTGRGMSQIGG
jgi:cyclic pyranopterin phosphate synthase